jgi:phytoene synthase
VVNESLTAQRAAERRVVLSYATAQAREGLAALLALDATLGGILRNSRDPMIAQMRLTWWHDALTGLDEAPPPAEPTLEMLARTVIGEVPGRALALQVEGWESLLDDPVSLDAYATARGGRLFAQAGRLLGAASGDPLEGAGAGWALVDLAANTSDPGLAGRARALAAPLLAGAAAARWSRSARALGAMAHLARLEEATPRRRIARVLFHRLTGR